MQQSTWRMQTTGTTWSLKTPKQRSHTKVRLSWDRLRPEGQGQKTHTKFSTLSFWPPPPPQTPPLRPREIVGRQHPAPNVQTLCNFETQTWLEIITSRDAKSACFQGSVTSCREIFVDIFEANFGQKRSHHVMDVSCWNWYELSFWHFPLH